MQSIETKFIAPTNTRGARIAARCRAKRIIVPYEYDQGGNEGMHDEAAFQLAKRLGWDGAWHKAEKADGTGNVYVRVDAHDKPAFSVL